MLASAVPAPMALRAELEDLIRKELLGPAGGEDEELPRELNSVRDRYLLGMLAPRRVRLRASENDRVRYTISEPARLEVLRRLSKLNRERWQAEQDAGAPDAASLRAAEATTSRRPQLTLVSPPSQPDMFASGRPL